MEALPTTRLHVHQSTSSQGATAGNTIATDPAHKVITHALLYQAHVASAVRQRVRCCVTAVVGAVTAAFATEGEQFENARCERKTEQIESNL